MDAISKFYDLMCSHGCPPKSAGDIKSDDKRHRLACALDKGSKTTIAYQLAVTDMGAYGWFRSYKHGASAGTTVNFSSKAKGVDRAAYADAVRASHERQRIEREKTDARQHRLALRLKKYVAGLPKAKAHQYLEKKKVGGHGIRVSAKTGELIIPIYQADGLPWSVQRINANGDKLFMTGARAANGYYPLATKEDPKDAIIICEGFATAATLREVSGRIVVCAFNAGNLMSVAKSMRFKYPEAKIIIAADNDRFTKDAKGDILNTGIEKGTAAAGAVSGFVIYPEFPADSESGTDWNDYVNTLGDEQLRDKIATALIPREAEIESENGGGESAGIPADVVSYDGPYSPPVVEPDWREQLQYTGTKEPKLKNNSFTNLALFFRHHDYFAGMYRLNEFQKDIFVMRCPPWRKDNQFKVRRMDDYELFDCAAHVEQFGLSSNINMVQRAIILAAESHKFNPARDYFDALKWDGTPRLAKWLTYYLGAEQEPEDYLSFVGRKWLTAAVKRIYEAGCKFDHVLVIEGAQGSGKSTALLELATFGSESYFTDNVKISDIGKDNTIQMLQGSIIVELAELAGFNKKDDEEMKGWISMREDRCRRPYDKTISFFPRQFVIAATTNSYEYLKDPSGNRRFWPVKVGALDIEAIKRDKEQLWAEAVYLYKSGLYIGPTPEEMKMAEAVQQQRMMEDNWEQDVLSAAQGLNGFNGFSTRDVEEKIGLQIRERNRATANRIAAILRANGYEFVNKRYGQSQRKVWVIVGGNNG
jgi:putative DNA primase/helicase